MNLVKLTAGLAVAQHPYFIHELRADNPDVGFPDDLTGVDLSVFNAAVVVQTAPPVYNRTTHDLVEVNPQKVGAVWEQRWSIVEASLTMQQSRFAAIGRQIDADVDAIYAAVQGNRGAEYALAEAEATAFRDGGYTGTAPASVHSWAVVKQQTDTWAADDILATANLWRTMQAAIRANRLQCKEGAKSAATVAAAQANWAAFLAGVKVQLGIA